MNTLRLKLVVFRWCWSLLALLAPSLDAAKEKIIIDADVGIDDAMAILLAYASPEFEVVGITTVFGNASIENGTRNALHLVSLLGEDTPVVAGAAYPLVIPPKPPTSFVHGDNGLGNIDYQFDERLAPLDKTAAEFIIEQSHQYPGELTLLPVGRLTNIALALRMDPTLPSRIRQVVIMGGAFAVPGNVTPVAEANIIGDPHAADIVFNAGFELTAIGLDVTTQIIVGLPELEALQVANPETGDFIMGISRFYLAFYRSIGVEQGFYVHDPATLLYLLEPSLFETQTAPVRVATEGIAMGQTMAAFPPHDTRKGDWYGKPKVQVALSVDSARAEQLFLERLGALKL